MNPCPVSIGDQSSIENTTSLLSSEDESKSLNFILNGSTPTLPHGSAVPSFMEEVYQSSCALFSTPKSTNSSVVNNSSVAWNEQEHLCNPLKAIFENGFTVLTELMDLTDVEVEDGSNILLFQNQQIVLTDERIAKYSSSLRNESSQTADHREVLNLYSAYLDGCSVVINHADLYSPWISSLCNDLQLTFPHVYANVYITPPHSQTVPPHSDDRDVFILQVFGAKEWTVYKRIPIPHPYPHEQVGKDRPVPDDVLQGPVLLQTTLQPGDVLYMPRGYVHEARCNLNSGSFHITIAIATHDWSLLGLLQEACRSLPVQLLPTAIYRKAILPPIGMQPTLSPDASEHAVGLQKQIDFVMQKLKEEFTVENVNTALYNKYQRHNMRAAEFRGTMIHCYVQSHSHPLRLENVLVGLSAARTVTLLSIIRAATPAEKNAARQLNKNDTACGLHVREEIHDAVLFIIQHVQRNPDVTFVVNKLRSIVLTDDGTAIQGESSAVLICDLTLLSMARRCVELAAFAIVPECGSGVCGIE